MHNYYIKELKGYAVAIGQGSAARSNVLNQMFPDIDLNELSLELRELRKALKIKSLESDDAAIDYAVGAAARAETDVTETKGSKLIEYLKEGGKALKDTAIEIGAKTLAEIIKSTVGM